MEAKQGEMRSAGLNHPSDTAVRKAISRDELLRHCRRRTRGAEQTTSAVEALACHRHSRGASTEGGNTCDLARAEAARGMLQDPHGIELHTSVEHMEKGGIRLPVFHCARGITSLESFHLRLARFNPGTSASAVIFQAFLVDGLVRWNRARAMAAHEGQGSMSEHLTYNSNINCTTFPFLKMLFAGTVKGSTALQQMKPASKVRLDIWHYVELVVSCTSKSHPLFMAYISM